MFPLVVTKAPNGAGQAEPEVRLLAKGFFTVWIQFASWPRAQLQSRYRAVGSASALSTQRRLSPRPITPALSPTRSGASTAPYRRGRRFCLPRPARLLDARRVQGHLRRVGEAAIPAQDAVGVRPEPAQHTPDEGGVLAPGEALGGQAFEEAQRG